MINFDKERFKNSIQTRLKRHYGKKLNEASKHDIYEAVSTAIMDFVQTNWMNTRKEYKDNKARQMHYLSAEFLMGRALTNNLINLGVFDFVKETLLELGFDYTEIEEQEADAGLGNGGLGRLAACFLDSLASLDYPGHGYGIRYRYGMFEQRIENGFQVEYPDNWLKNPDTWQVRRQDEAVRICFGGTPVAKRSANGHIRYKIVGAEQIIATPYDIPIIGFKTNTVNRLRLWEASSPDGFDLQLFNEMHYNRAVEKKNSAENISRVLYPNDMGPSGKTLRLKQQYFFSSASLQDMLAKFIRDHGTDLTQFADYYVIQLNDTHPVVAIPELMRLLIDEHGFGWDDAWTIVTKTFAYTNHTILSEALEKWPVEIFQELLPRVYQIIDEINRRFNAVLREKYPQDWKKQNKMAIISNGMIHMAWLAIYGCFSVNGVAALHTEILKTVELADWYELYPEKFNNKTNGVTQRRWLLSSNPRLAAFITKKIGSDWNKDLTQLKKLEAFVDDPSSLEELMEIKQKNKTDLAQYLKETQNIFIDPDSIFDIQIKRLHEYKRQLLNVLHIMYLYNQILENPNSVNVPHTFIFGAKAASGYRRAKTIIKLINTVADKINNDSRVKGKIRVVFVENYRVSVAEKLFPASDVSEQISTAGKEASGTGNMKFMINGAITIGTLDGANVEILEEAGAENVFIFGLTTKEIQSIEAEHSYNPQEYLIKNPELQKVVNQLVDGTYGPEGESLFREIYDSLIFGVEGQRPDVYYVLADFDAYVETQKKLVETYKDKEKWAKMALLNIARSGKFSSDRTIEEYAKEIWKIKRRKN